MLVLIVVAPISYFGPSLAVLNCFLILYFAWCLGLTPLRKPIVTMFHSCSSHTCLYIKQWFVFRASKIVLFCLSLWYGWGCSTPCTTMKYFVFFPTSWYWKSSIVASVGSISVLFFEYSLSCFISFEIVVIKFLCCLCASSSLSALILMRMENSYRVVVSTGP